MIKNIFKLLYSSSLIKNSGIYTISSLINSAIPLLLLPILTSKLTPTDYGIIAMFQLAVSIILPFIGINLDVSVQRKYYDQINTNLSIYIGNCIIIFSISFCAVLGIFLVFNKYILLLTQLPSVLLLYIPIVAACQFITSIVLIIFQIKIKPFKYGAIQIAQSLINVLLTLFFILVLKKTWDGRIDSQIISGILFAIISIIILVKSNLINITYVKSDIIYALKFGLPLVPHAISAMLFTAIDRFFLTKQIGLEQTGNYTVAFQLGTLISLLTTAFNNAFIPWLFENLNKNCYSSKVKIVKITYIYYVVIVLVALILLIVFPILVKTFVGDSFTTVNLYSTFIVFGFVFQGMYFMVANYIYFICKTHLLALLTISIGLIKLPITYYSIKHFGAIGAAISYFITFFLLFFATWGLSIYLYKMPWFTFRFRK